MRRLILTATAALIVLAVAAPARGGDTDGYSPNLALSLKGGVWSSDVNGVDPAGAYGIEVSADDPVITPVVGKLRHMVSLNHADHDGLSLKTVEWNAHWVFPTANGFWLGAGPGIGYVWADGRDRDDSPAVQFGLSSTYEIGHALLGFETRYQWTTGDSTDNWLTMLKMGYKF